MVINQHKVDEINVRKAERLIECECIILTGLGQLALVADALIEIRETRLYIENYDNFEDYCKDKWSFSGRHARNLMAASKVLNNMTGTVVPLHERQTRELSKLPPEEQESIWKETQESTSKEQPTAKEIKTIIDSKKIPESESCMKLVVDNDNTDESETDTYQYDQVLYDKAERYVIDKQDASISRLSRFLDIADNRVVMLLEDMETNGVVSEPQSPGGTRIILHLNSLPKISKPESHKDLSAEASKKLEKNIENYCLQRKKTAEKSNPEPEQESEEDLYYKITEFPFSYPDFQPAELAGYYKISIEKTLSFIKKMEAEGVISIANEEGYRTLGARPAHPKIKRLNLDFNGDIDFSTKMDKGTFYGDFSKSDLLKIIEIMD
ncbi:MAG: hypothetical protein KZQ83_14825 [gamma proteobacterium symbiont of Taylorina sp.]|nr:hypothetical protein [gamma proteobacterium symbiont of Taylorina sp.]